MFDLRVGELSLSKCFDSKTAAAQEKRWASEFGLLTWVAQPVSGAC